MPWHVRYMCTASCGQGESIRITRPPWIEDYSHIHERLLIDLLGGFILSCTGEFISYLRLGKQEKKVCGLPKEEKRCQEPSRGAWRAALPYLSSLHTPFPPLSSWYIYDSCILPHPEIRAVAPLLGLARSKLTVSLTPPNGGIDPLCIAVQYEYYIAVTARAPLSHR